MKADNSYVSYLDGFRGYAILFVLLSHFGLAQLDIAFLGVTLFFFVSGFLITKLMIVEFSKKDTISLKEFYIRRLLRLYPALILMLLVSIIVLLIHNYQIIWNDILSGIFYFTNYYLVYFKPPLPDENYLLVSKILWSLSVEEHFYIIFPFVFSLLYSKTNKKFYYIILSLLVIFLLVRIGIYFSNSDRSNLFQQTYYPTHTRADSILYGCFSALLIYRYPANWYKKLYNSHFWVAVSFIILGTTLIYNNLFFQTTVKYTLQGLAFFIIIPAFASLYKTGFVNKIVDNKLMVYIGKLCYSLYLFHWVALKIANFYFDGNSLQWLALTISITVILSLFSYYVVEKPFVRLRRKFGSNAKIA